MFFIHRKLRESRELRKSAASLEVYMKYIVISKFFFPFISIYGYNIIFVYIWLTENRRKLLWVCVKENCCRFAVFCLMMVLMVVKEGTNSSRTTVNLQEGNTMRLLVYMNLMALLF